MRWCVILCCLLSCTSGPNQAQSTIENHKEVLLLMGTRFEITAMAESKEIAEKAVWAGIKEIQRIEALISSWQATSQTTAINNNAGIAPVKVDLELMNLIDRSLKVSQLTEGAFDISFASMERLYSFDKEEHELPDKADRMRAIQKIDYHKIILDRENASVYLQEKGMRIGFGGIGKGYAANKAKEIMSDIPGVLGGVVNAAGDLIAWGDNGKENGWPIQISDPQDIAQSIGWLNIQDMSVVTSGDYEKYFMHQGTRYAHIINPKTGLPTTGIKSATIICPDAEVGDALATALFIIGPERAIAFVNTLKNIEALIITDDDQVLSSQNLQLNTY